MTPDEFFPFLSRLPFLSFETFHLLALATEKRSVEARIEIVFLNTNGLFSRMDDPYVEKRTDHLAEMATTAFFGVNFNFH